MQPIRSIKTLPISNFVYTVDSVYHLSYNVVKFDGLLNVEDIHPVTALRGGHTSCECAGGRFGKCRHRPLVILFDFMDRTNKRWFYDYDTKIWYLPINLNRR